MHGLSNNNNNNKKLSVKAQRFKGWSIMSTGSTRHIRIQNKDNGYVTEKLYKFLNIVKSTSRCSNSSKSVSCTSSSSPQWFDSKCPSTESSSGAMSQTGQGWLLFPWWLNTLLNNWSPWYARPHSPKPRACAKVCISARVWIDFAWALARQICFSRNLNTQLPDPPFSLIYTNCQYSRDTPYSLWL